MIILDNDIVLFQGDSVTDTGRNYEDKNNLGSGYAMMSSVFFAATFPEKNVKFINRGVNGNRSKDLENRWKEDCLDLKPTVVTILIGINDCWRRYDEKDATSIEKFKATYHKLLTQTKEHNNPKIILMEPFLLPVQEMQSEWREDLDPKINAVRELAREFGAELIPLDGVFNKASTHKPLTFWTIDGVHPTEAGHALITREWLKVVSAL